MGRPREHGDETRQQLLDAASRILTEEGPHALTNRRLAADVGTTTRAIYSVFGGKDGLMRALFHESAREVAAALGQVPERDDPRDELLELALAYRQAAIERPDLYRLQFEGGLGGYEPSEDDRELSRRNFGRVLRTVGRAVDAGLFPGRSAELITLQTWATNHGLASLEIHGHLPPSRAEAHWRDHITAMIRGYQEPPVAPTGD